MQTYPHSPFINVKCRTHNHILSEDTGMIGTKTLIDHRECALDFTQENETLGLTFVEESEVENALAAVGR